MSKSILTIDTPVSCENCPLCILLDLYRCTVNKRYCGDEQGYFTSSTMPSWCPLKKLKDWEKENSIKISEGNYDSDEDYEKQIRCLDEVWYSDEN